MKVGKEPVWKRKKTHRPKWSQIKTLSSFRTQRLTKLNQRTVEVNSRARLIGKKLKTRKGPSFSEGLVNGSWMLSLINYGN